jgi:hypothetical protein
MQLAGDAAVTTQKRTLAPRVVAPASDWEGAPAEDPWRLGLAGLDLGPSGLDLGRAGPSRNSRLVDGCVLSPNVGGGWSCGDLDWHVVVRREDGALTGA